MDLRFTRSSTYHEMHIGAVQKLGTCNEYSDRLVARNICAVRPLTVIKKRSAITRGHLKGTSLSFIDLSLLPFFLYIAVSYDSTTNCPNLLLEW